MAELYRNSGVCLNKHKVPQGYSPAEENAGSLTPFGMTAGSGVRLHSGCQEGWFKLALRTPILP